MGFSDRLDACQLQLIGTRYTKGTRKGWDAGRSEIGDRKNGGRGRKDLRSHLLVAPVELDELALIVDRAYQ
jgi:hypothetical protein